MAWPIVQYSLKLFYQRLGMFLVGNLLWLLVSLPIVTIPAATGALFYLVQRVIAEERERDADLATTQHFWEGLRLFWKQATVLGFIDFAALLLLIFTIRFYNLSSSEFVGWLVGPVLIVLVVFLGMQLYLFPLLINGNHEPVWAIFRRAFFLTLSFPLDTVMLVIWLTILVILCFALAGPVLLILFSLLALIQSMALRFIRIQRGEIIEEAAKED